MAVFVLRQAIQDAQLHFPARPADGADAVDFLLRRLWQPSNLWGELLRGALPSRRIVGAEVKRLMHPDVRRRMAERGVRLFRSVGVAA